MIASQLHDWSNRTKVVVALGAIIIAAVLGYLVVYSWVFRDFSQVFSFNVLKNQIVANQRSSDVQEELRSLGYQFDDGQFFPLSDPQSTNYRADVLGGYEPVQIENEQLTEEGYYFYDANGMAYYVKVDKEGKVDPSNIVPLMIH